MSECAEVAQSLARVVGIPSTKNGCRHLVKMQMRQYFHGQVVDESPQVIDNIAEALWRSRTQQHRGDG